MNDLSVFRQGWNLKALLFSHLFAFAWLGFFLTDTGFNFWRSIDHNLFFILNGTLAEADNWTRFWAWANVRIFDLVPLLIMLVSLTFPGFGIKRDRLQQALIGFILLLVLMFPIRESVYEYARAIGLSGASPSLMLEPAFRFSQIVPDIPAKDSAGHSFPGDHAAVVLTWAGFMILNARSWLSVSALLLAMLFMLPRIVGGAHWASDNLVGGAFSAMITLSWAFNTPIMHKATLLAHKALLPLIRLIARIPLLNRLPILSSSR
ncbi:phosphatase PAP2 family protein [Neptuniibacter halophilus]|uniref:phosphatase PAP2 family protein n=1 Tax=Neptuniibacter halophilus TaxID=651666 RepID=UPI002572BC4E|nr:phosphatase PAP2 family protein [Neptuniibacter halophilus]